MFTRRRFFLGVLFAAVLVASFTISALLRMRGGVPEVDGIDDIVDIRLAEGVPFEIFKVSGKEIYHVEFDTMKRQDEALNVILLFSDDPLYHGKILAQDEMIQAKKDNTLAVGHNYSFATLERFFTGAREQGVGLSDDTRILLDRFSRLGVFGREGGIISTAQDVQDRKRVITHEFSHGRYFSDPEYRRHVKRIWMGLPQNMQRTVKSIFSQYNYNLNDEDLVLREFAAWFEDENFTFSTIGKTKELFIKIREDLLAYP